jgi:hypothetical protein
VYQKKVSFKTTIKSLSNIFFQNTPSILLCDFNDVDPFLLNSITWYKDGKLIDPNKLNTYLSNEGRYLNFNAIFDHTHNGLYRCEVKLIGYIDIFSSDDFSLTVQ